MSNRIMALCWQLGGMSGTEKAVLIALADRADDAGMCWPSIATLAQMTCFTDRAVQKCIHSLLGKGLISVQVSAGGKSNKYVINPEQRSPSVEKLANANGAPYSPLNGEPRSPRTSFTPNHVHRNGEPRSPNGEPRSPKPSITIREPSIKVLRPDDVEDSLWREWVAHRKAKRAAVTEGVLKTFRQEATKASFTLADAMRKSIDRGWTGFEAEWVARETRHSAKPMTSKNFREGVSDDGRIH